MRTLIFLIAALVLNGVMYASSDEIRSAEQAAQNGEVKTAIIKLKNLLQENPEDAEARFSLGKIYIKAGEIASAEKELRRAQQLGMPVEKVAELILDAYVSQGKFDEVMNYLGRYQTSESRLQATFHAFEGIVKLSRKQEARAKELFDQAVGLDANNLRATLGLASYYIGQNQDQEALKLLSAFLDQDSSNVRVLALRGELLRKAGKLDEAEKDYLQVLNLNPNFSQARLGLAFIQATRKDPDAVLATIEKLPAQFQKSPVSKYLTGLSWYLKQDMDKAEENLQEVLKFVPDHVQTHLLSGIIYYSRENWQLAESHLSRAHKQFSGNTSIIKLLASTYLKLEQPDKAESLLKPHLLKTTQPDAQLLALLGTTYLQQGNNTQAQEMFNKAIAAAPDQSALKTRLAFGLLAGGDTDKAISTLETVVDVGEDQIQADVLLVMSHLRAGNHDQAISISEKMQSRYQDSPIPYNLTGLALLSAQKYPEADRAFVKSLEIDPEFEVAIINRARNALAAGNEAGAEKFFNDALEKNSRNTTALLALAEVARKRGDNDLRENYLQKVLDVQSGNLVAVSQMAEMLIQRKEPLKALSLIAGISGNTENNPVVLRLQGMAQLAAAQTSSAITTFDQLVKLVPDNIEANFQLGRAYLINNELDKAQQYFSKAAEKDNNYSLPMVWLALGDVALKQKDYDEVLKLTDSLMDAKYDLPAIYELRAAAYQGKGNQSEVMPLLKRAYIKEPTQQRVSRLASFYSQSGNADKAIEILKNWLSGHADDASMQTMLAMIFQQKGDNANAVSAYEKSLEIQPDNAVVMNNLAWLYHQSGDSRAIKLAGDAYEKARKRPEIVDTYGWILFENGKHNEALPILQEALLQSPSHPEIAFHVAVALRKVNRAKEAEPILRRIVRNSPNSVHASKAKALLEQ